MLSIHIPFSGWCAFSLLPVNAPTACARAIHFFAILNADERAQMTDGLENKNDPRST
jgi:hypothetical protein